jgi:LL-diaminopimelate aminotransferase
MIQRNPTIARLQSGYLFPEINLRKRQFLATHPEANLISLGIGDTTEPISSSVTESLVEISNSLGTPKGYVGYGPEQGIDALRQKIATVIYKNRIDPEDVFISDGAKCDIGRLQALFGRGVRIAVQDPAYPVYIDGSIIHGVDEIHRIPCSPENGFFPDLNLIPRVDLLYFCSPNNPTGAASSLSQLEDLVSFAKKNRSIIIFDSAYAAYIQDPNLPRSIFEINGAQDVAIEVGSFSKLAGFTGVRLGWTVVPKALKYGSGESIRNDWNRIVTTVFNGASIIAQHGGIASLTDQGYKEVNSAIGFYLENAALIKLTLEKMGYEVFGGVHAPYLWVQFPGRKSWDVFQEILEKAHIVTTPGAGFGPSGEGFVRFSAYGKRQNILCAIERLENMHNMRP